MTFKLKLLPAALLLAGLYPLAAQAVVLPIIADTYLATTTAGTSVAVNVNPSNKALLNFDVSTLPAGITSADIAKATLVFFVKTVPTGGRLQVSPLTSAWTENTVNTSNAPTAALPLATSANISNGNTYFAVDVTELAKNWVDVPTTNFGLALDPLASTLTSLTLDSKEAIQTSHPAYIEIALKGPAGDKGATGLQGPTGLTGPVGVTGATGLQGVKGDTGATGLQGPIGLAGINGTNGAQGIPGPVGNTGPVASVFKADGTQVTSPHIIADSVSITANNNATITFPTLFTNVPICTVTGNTNTVAKVTALTSAKLTIGLGISTTETVSYICIGN